METRVTRFRRVGIRGRVLKRWVPVLAKGMTLPASMWGAAVASGGIPSSCATTEQVMQRSNTPFVRHMHRVQFSHIVLMCCAMVSGPTEPNSKTRPSAGPAAVNWCAMLPPAPALFSTVTAMPRLFPRFYVISMKFKARYLRNQK